MSEVSKAPVLACHQLAKIYIDGKLRVPVFAGIDLVVLRGETVAVMGASGAGKSTLLQLLGGLDKPTQGRVLLDNRDIATLSERARCQLRNEKLGFIYQFHHLLPEFSALENVCMPLLIRGLSKKIILSCAKAMIEKVGVSHRLAHRVGELSGGERQRIAIARALVNQPACVLADEPTGNLDQRTADQVFSLMLQLNHDLQTSFVIVTHNAALAQRCHRVLHLKNGQLSE